MHSPVHWFVIGVLALSLGACGSTGSSAVNDGATVSDANNGGDTNAVVTTDSGSDQTSSSDLTGDPTLSAFPGAEGFGAAATGGRGGTVCYVTNLSPDGNTPNSLQWCVDQPGKRMILFKVSGLIDGPVLLSHGDFTIAGQTSPGGVIVRGLISYYEPEHKIDNFIIRHLRSRPQSDPDAANSPGSDDALRLEYARMGIIDHVSLAGAIDEAVQLSRANRITIQNTMISETLGEHATLGGMLINYSDPDTGYELNDLSIHHNVWNRILGRLPELARESWPSAGSTLRIELSNNLLWDPGYPVAPGINLGQLETGTPHPIYYAMNWVGNYSVVRAHVTPAEAQLGIHDYTFGMMENFLVHDPERSQTFFSDNQISAYPGRGDYQLLYCCNDYPDTLTAPDGLPFPAPQSPPSAAQTVRLPYPPITYTKSSELVAHMIKNVGAFPRDPMDRRLLAPLKSGVIDPSSRHLNPAKDTFALDFDPNNPPAAPLDSDGDGIPDAWEDAHALNKNDPSDGAKIGSLSQAIFGVAGYTNLEVYLNQLAEQLVAAP